MRLSAEEHDARAGLGLSANWIEMEAAKEVGDRLQLDRVKARAGCFAPVASAVGHRGKRICCRDFFSS